MNSLRTAVRKYASLSPGEEVNTDKRQPVVLAPMRKKRRVVDRRTSQNDAKTGPRTAVIARTQIPQPKNGSWRPEKALVTPEIGFEIPILRSWESPRAWNTR
jgi:hypothetical protein